MSREDFLIRKTLVEGQHQKLIEMRNMPVDSANGVFERFEHPILTAGHVPIEWRYDLDYESNPYFMERLGVNAVFNCGAIYHNGKVALVGRIEGNDRKSFFGIAESEGGINNFRFNDYPIVLPETDDPDVNVYDMRLVHHEDGWIYGLFCTERKDKNAPI